MISPFQKIRPLSTLHTNHLQLSAITITVHLHSKHILMGTFCSPMSEDDLYVKLKEEVIYWREVVVTVTPRGPK